MRRAHAHGRARVGERRAATAAAHRVGGVRAHAVQVGDRAAPPDEARAAAAAAPAALRRRDRRARARRAVGAPRLSALGAPPVDAAVEAVVAQPGQRRRLFLVATFLDDGCARCTGGPARGRRRPVGRAARGRRCSAVRRDARGRDGDAAARFGGADRALAHRVGVPGVVAGRRRRLQCTGSGGTCRSSRTRRRCAAGC